MSAPPADERRRQAPRRLGSIPAGDAKDGAASRRLRPGTPTRSAIRGDVTGSQAERPQGQQIARVGGSRAAAVEPTVRRNHARITFRGWGARETALQNRDSGRPSEATSLAVTLANPISVAP